VFGDVLGGHDGARLEVSLEEHLLQVVVQEGGMTQAEALCIG
jgi:hypothetical protein